MFRTTRVAASLARRVLLGSVALTTVGAASMVVGCQDETQPAYWVDQLAKPAGKAKAIKRLELFFEDTMTKANSDRNDPRIAALLDQITVPLTTLYVSDYDTLDDKSRSQLIKLLKSIRDPRTEPALAKALDEYAKRPRNKDYDDLKMVAFAQKFLKLPGLAEPMIGAFQKLRASTPVGSATYRDFAAAMLAAPSKSWSGPLQQALDGEMVMPGPGTEGDAVDAFRDQLFWQTTAAQLLGEIGDPGSVPALLRTMLDPSKASVQPTAVLALTKLGKPATAGAMALLEGKDTALVNFGLAKEQKASGLKELPTDQPYVRTAAIVLGTIGRAEAAPSFLAAMKATKSAKTLATLAHELSRLPATPDTKRAFQDAFESIPTETAITQDRMALLALTEAASAFRDPTMVPWLLKRGPEARGTKTEKRVLQLLAVQTAIKLMEPEQLGLVEKAVKDLAADIDKSGDENDKLGLKDTQAFFKSCSELLTACGDRFACYLAKLEDPATQTPENQPMGIKAAYMLSVYGDESMPKAVIAKLGAVQNAAIRHTIAQSIDQLCPNGSIDSADSLDAIIEANKASGDRAKAVGDNSLTQVMYRLRSRAN